jgi:hypothetical protein
MGQHRPRFWQQLERACTERRLNNEGVGYTPFLFPEAEYFQNILNFDLFLQIL